MIEGISKQTIENFNRMSENRKIVLVGLVNENVKKAMSLLTTLSVLLMAIQNVVACGMKACRFIHMNIFMHLVRTHI